MDSHCVSNGREEFCSIVSPSHEGGSISCADLTLIHYRMHSCYLQWKEITDLPADKLRVKDREKKARRQAQAMKAFEAYQKQQPQTHSTTSEPPVLPPLRVQADLEIGSGYSFFASTPSFTSGNEPSSLASTPNIHALPFLSPNGPTPGPIETLTPQDEGQDIYNGPISTDVSIDGMTPGHNESPADDTKGEVMKKRALPSDFDLGASRVVRRAFTPTKTSIRQGEAWPEAKRSSLPDGNIYNGKGHEAEENVADLEKRMGVQPGFIDFVKNRLSITGTSIASALSSSGSVRSRWSRKPSRQITHDLLDLRQEPGQVSLPGDGSQRAQHTPLIGQPIMTGAQASPVLCELLASSSSDNDDQIAERMRSQIDTGANVNMPNEHGETPLHLAVRFGNVPACELLLKNGANVYAKTNDKMGISSYGKMFEKKVENDSSLYVAIRTCRNLVRGHSPGQDTKKASKRVGRTQPATSKRSKLRPKADAGGSKVNPSKGVNSEDIEACQLPQKGPSQVVGSMGSFTSFVEPTPDGYIGHWNSENNFMKGESTSQIAASPQNFVNHSAGSQSTYGVPRTPQDFPLSRPPTRTPPKVREMVEAIEDRQSTKPLPSMNGPQHSYSSSLQDGEPSSTQSGSRAHSQSEFMFSAPAAQRSASANLPRHGHIFYSTMPQQSLMAMAPPPTRSLAHEFSPHVPLLNPISSLPIVLSGYLDQDHNGQNFLVCPLPNDVSLELRHASSNCASTMVRIIWPPSVGQSHTEQGTHDRNFVEPATAQAMPGQDIPAVPPWAVVQDIASSNQTQSDTLSYNNLALFDLDPLANNPSVMNPLPQANIGLSEPDFIPSHPSDMEAASRESFPALFNPNSTPTYHLIPRAPNQMLLGLGDRFAQGNGNVSIPPGHRQFRRIRFES
jgi:hypothetical protein